MTGIVQYFSLPHPSTHTHTCRYGIPVSPLSSHTYSSHALTYDRARRVPLWTAERLTRQQVRSKQVNREHSEFKVSTPLFVTLQPSPPSTPHSSPLTPLPSPPSTPHSSPLTPLPSHLPLLTPLPSPPSTPHSSPLTTFHSSLLSPHSSPLTTFHSSLLSPHSSPLTTFHSSLLSPPTFHSSLLSPHSSPHHLPLLTLLPSPPSTPHSSPLTPLPSPPSTPHSSPLTPLPSPPSTPHSSPLTPLPSPPSTPHSSPLTPPQPDPVVPPPFTSTNEDYWDSGWSRGHMVPAADCKHSQLSMDESFFLTNVVPQDIDNNGGYMACKLVV